MKTKISILTVTMLMVLSAILVMPDGMENAKAETWTQTTDSDFASGVLENVEIVGTDDGALIQLEKKNELGVWHQQQLIPSARSSSAMAYDSKNNKIVLFGGNDGAVDDETWVYDVASDTWTQKSPITKPSARDRHAMVYDSANNKIVLFGGNDGARDDETWVYDLVLDAWTQKSPSTSPGARENHAMVYDAVNKKVVLFGGNDGGLDAETWVYDLASDTWTDKSPATKPSARDNHAMAYDSANNKVVLFGGWDGDYDADTWVYDLGLNTWTLKSPSTSPSARRYHAMAYDSMGNKIVLFGGNDGGLNAETWVYDIATDTWTQKSPSTKPTARSSHAMVYDSANDKVVIFGGDDGALDDETWVYDLGSNSWTQKSTGTYPSQRRCFSMAYDSTNKKVVIFGGMMGFWLDETWVYEVASDNWTQMNPSTKPSDRNGHAMVYDSANNKIVLFGGYNSGGANDETWVYDVASNTWTEKTPSTSPSARQRHAMAYDSLNNKVVLFGGLSGGDQTWVYDTAANTWTQMSPSTKPTSRAYHTMAYDSENNKVVLFGGNDGSYDDETWLYDTASNTWTLMNPTIKPSARESSRMQYDSANERVILFGGLDSSGRDDETWVYDIDSDNWTQKNPIIKPLPRQRHKMTFDSDNKKLVLFGGWDDGGAYDDQTWIYNYNNYYNAGTYTSKTFTSNNYKWHRITWGADTDPDGFVRFQVAVNNDGNTWNYVGPDGTSSTFYDEVTGGNLFSGYNGKYLRYRAYFTTPYAGCTPKLHEVSITYITEKPTVTVTSPNGGEDWMKGAYYPITWNSEGDFNATPVCLYYSTDNGATWTTILNWTENTGYYNWTVPSVTTASGLIKVSVLDIYGIEESDCSDASFAIDPPPPISGDITSPGASTIWSVGEHAIQWNLGGYMGTITLEYTMDGQNWTEIGGGLPNTNSYTWDIPSDMNSKSARIRLKVQDEYLNVHTFLSNVFTIDTESPVISHEPVTDGIVDNAITFQASTSDNFEVTSVTLYNNQGSGFMPVALSEIDGVYRASITPTEEGTMEYYITVSDGANSVVTDVYQVDVRLPEKSESKEESGFPWFIGASLVCGVIAGIVIGLALNRYLPKKEK